MQPQGEDAVARPVAPADRIELWNAFNLVLRRLAERIQPGNITTETVTVSDRMEAILARLETGDTFTFCPNGRPSVSSWPPSSPALNYPASENSN